MWLKLYALSRYRKSIPRTSIALWTSQEAFNQKMALTEIRRSCRVAGVKARSMKGLRARVSMRTLRKRIKAREGAKGSSRAKQPAYQESIRTS
jgi:hypothetical protein